MTCLTYATFDSPKCTSQVQLQARAHEVEARLGEGRVPQPTGGEISSRQGSRGGRGPEDPLRGDCTLPASEEDSEQLVDDAVS